MEPGCSPAADCVGERLLRQSGVAGSSSPILTPQDLNKAIEVKLGVKGGGLASPTFHQLQQLLKSETPAST